MLSYVKFKFGFRPTASLFANVFSLILLTAPLVAQTPTIPGGGTLSSDEEEFMLVWHNYLNDHFLSDIPGRSYAN